MKDNLVITIGREYGSGGREVGKKLALRLGIAFYDRELITRAAKKSGFDEEMFEQLAKQMAEKQGVTEALKAGDMMAWVRKMNNIRNAAEEAIYNEIIYA